MGGWIGVGFAIALGLAAGVTVHAWWRPVPEPLELPASDSAQVERILYKLGLVDVDLSRCTRTDTIAGRLRIVSLHLDGRRLPGVDRKRTWSERWGRRPVILAGISNLSELRELKLANVIVSELPEEIGRLEQLEYLEVANGRLTSLPDSLGEALALKFLYLQNNQIPALPPAACSLERLQVLMVSGNQGFRLPPGNCLENLKTLYIDRSQVERMPKHLLDRIRLTTGKAN